MKRLVNWVRRFRLEEAGSMSVEAALIFPMLLWAYGGMYVFWDAYKTRTTMSKATYTIADMISRERSPIDQAYLDGMQDVYDFLTHSNHPTRLRVSVVLMESDGNGGGDLRLMWSHATAGMTPHSTIDNIEDFVPLLAVGEYLFLVETTMAYEPILNLGLQPRVLTGVTVAAPRFVPQICWESCA